jgi:hypothetical protein
MALLDELKVVLDEQKVLPEPPKILPTTPEILPTEPEILPVKGSERIIHLDFTDYPKLYEKIVKEAEDSVRTPQQYLIYLLRQAYS